MSPFKKPARPEKLLPQFIFYQLNQNWLCSALIVSYTAGIGSSSTLIALQRVWRSRRGNLPRSSGPGRRAWVQTFQSKQNETQKSDFFHSLLLHHPQAHLTGSKWSKQSWQNRVQRHMLNTHTVNQNHLNYTLSRKIGPGQLFPDALCFVFLKARHLFVVKENKSLVSSAASHKPHLSRDSWQELMNPEVFISQDSQPAIFGSLISGKVLSLWLSSAALIYAAS